jgi:hypothetical protein
VRRGLPKHVDEIGWEGGSSISADMEHFTNAALIRLRDWRP